MTMEHAITLFSISLPVSAGIFKWMPQRKTNGNGEKYVTVREFDRFTSRIEAKIDGLEMLLKSRI